MPSGPDAGVEDFIAGLQNGVQLTEALVRRKSEHNDGMLSTLEEIALHQLDIGKIETLNNCRCLKIVYLQSNLISKIEGLHKLKQLDYLNLSLNNISRIENLEGCEALYKLDLTCNFIDCNELHTITSLKNNTLLHELYLTGNPCTQSWPNGYRDYVIATLPQIEKLDGNDVLRAERIKAMQRLPELERELASLAPMTAQKRAEQIERQRVRQLAIDAGEIIVTNETVDEWCPEVRIKDSRELRKIEEDKQEYRRHAQNNGSLFPDQAARERRFFKDDGTPVQMNTAKWPFSIEEDGANVYVDIALPKFLDSAAVDADVQPTYVRLTAKKNICQLLLPSEVLTDATVAKRSATTGHLLLTCPKLCPVVVSKAPQDKKKLAAKKALEAAATPMLRAPGDGLTGSVDIRSIVPKVGEKPRERQAAQMTPALGPDYDEEDDVPALL